MSRAEEDPQLAAFQEALLEALFADGEHGERQGRLAADPRTAPFAAYVAGFDARCVEMVARQMRQWGERDPG